MMIFKKIITLVLFITVFASIVSATSNVCLCEPFELGFGFTNVENFEETYTLSAEALLDYLSVSENPVSIGPEETKEIRFSINLPCNSTVGTYSFNVILDGEKSNKRYKVPVQFFASSCEGFSLERGEDFEVGTAAFEFSSYKGNYSVCLGEDRFIPFLVTNLDKDPHNYEFNIDGAEWVSVIGGSFSLVPQQQAVVYVALDTPSDIEDEQTLYAVVSDESGNEKELSFDVIVDRCYGVDVSIEKGDGLVCGCSSVSYDVNITNVGSKPGNFQFSTMGPKWAYLVINGTQVIPSGETRKQKLVVEPPCNDITDAEISVIANSVNDTEVEDSDTLKLKLLTEDACYDTEIKIKERIDVNYAGRKIPLTIKNNGKRDINYEISVLKPEWVSISSDEVLLAPGEKSEIGLLVEPRDALEEGDYELELGVSYYGKTDIASSNLRLKKSRFWVYGLIFGIVILALMVIGIYSSAKTKKRRTRKKKKVNFALIVWLVVVLLLILAAVYLLWRFNLWRNLIWNVYWYQYYIYLGIIIIVLAYALFVYVKNMTAPLRERMRKEEIKKARLRALARARAARASNKKSRKDESVQASQLWIWLSVIIIILIIGFGLYYYSAYISSFFANLYSDQGVKADEAQSSSSVIDIHKIFGSKYIVAGALFILLTLIVLFVVGKMVKQGKKKDGYFQKTLRNFGISATSLIVIIVAWYLLVYYGLIGYVNSLFTDYLLFVVIGIVLLFIIIFFLRLSPKWSSRK